MPSTQTRYYVTEGALTGTKQSAEEALAEQFANKSACMARTTNRLTRNRLIALMLSVPVHEIAAGRSASLDSSPMTLSRWDGINVRPDNFRLYSFGTYPGEKRAHWNPGVGLWQLDIWDPVTQMNHAQRANTAEGGVPVAKLLRDEFCADTTGTMLKGEYKTRWHGCHEGELDDQGRWVDDRGNVIPAELHWCYNTYLDMYDAASDRLYLSVRSGADPAGGLFETGCRWGTANAANGLKFDCFRYDVENSRQGYAPVEDLPGDDARTPLAAAFLSFTDPVSKVKFAAFPTSVTVSGDVIIKAVPERRDPRDPIRPIDNMPAGHQDGWYRHSYGSDFLWMRQCPTCQWVRP